MTEKQNTNKKTLPFVRSAWEDPPCDESHLSDILGLSPVIFPFRLLNSMGAMSASSGGAKGLVESEQLGFSVSDRLIEKESMVLQ